MSESHRDHDRSSTRSLSHAHGHAKVDPDRSSRKRSHLDSENMDAKVYIRNLPTKKATDDELLDFFRPYGKISDIRVFKDHIFVQYNRVEDASRLIKDAQVPLLFKGVQLDILPAREVRSTSSKSSSTDRSSRRNYDHRSSSTYEPERKRCASRERPSSNEPKPVNSPLPYAILTGPKDTDAFVDCQIIIVNVRQREYAEEIESRLRPHRLITSIILLREDYTLVKAIDNAARLQCLYGIIAMPMHAERRTASFHILYGETEEHRNLAMEDGIDIIVKNFVSFKKRLRDDEPEPYQSNNDAVVYSHSSPAYDVQHQSSHHAQDQITPPVLALGDKLPLSMLLCLLADGRQLTLEEIDRVLVYLLEKKAKMLTLPPGTLPPLPAQYATVATYNQASGSVAVSDTRPASRSDHSPGKSSSSSTADASSVIAEQIRQILSSNIAKPNSSTGATISPPIVNEPLKIDRPNAPAVSNNSIKDSPKDFAPSSHNVQAAFAFAKSEPTPAIPPPFNYVASNFQSLPLNPGLKPATPLSVPNFVSQASSYFYQVPGQSVYQSPLSTATTAANTAAALFQAYSQYTVQPNGTTSMINQPISAAQPPIRK